MSKSQQNLETAKLIVKSILGNLSDTEQSDFDKWLSLPGNKDFYAEILRAENIEQKFQSFDSVDTQSAYSKFLQKIQSDGQVKNRQTKFDFRKIYKYAALLLIMLSVGVGIIYFSSQPILEEKISTVDDLSPGYNKATLVLEDGSQINLEENNFAKQQALADVENSNNTLIYKGKETQHKNDSTPDIPINSLFVPVGGLYKLVLSDGSKVWLNSSSSLKYPVSFSSEQRVVELSGEAYFEVKESTKDFVVKTKTRDVLVLGTSFNVSTYNDDPFFAATLNTGKIKLIDQQHENIFLIPGQQAIIDRKDLSMVNIESVDPNVHSAWKDGTFFFENESLEKILHKVGRWYNFETNFTDPKLMHVTFTGLVSKEFPAKRLLDMISKSTKIKYEIIQDKSNEAYIIEISRRE